MIREAKNLNTHNVAAAVPLGLSKTACHIQTMSYSGCAIGIVKNGLPKSNHVIVAVPLGLSKQFAKRSLCNSRCTIGIRDAETFNKGYMTHAVPLGLSKKVCQKKSM